MARFCSNLIDIDEDPAPPVPIDVPASRTVGFSIDSGQPRPPKDDSTFRRAAYKSGSGTTTVNFSYTVGAADYDRDGVHMPGVPAVRRDGTAEPDGSRIQGFGGAGDVTVSGTGFVVYPVYSALDAQLGHKVDGRPDVESVSLTSAPKARSDTFSVGEVIRVQVDFSQRMTAASDAVFYMSFDGDWKRAPYVSGNGTKSLVFEYVVQATDRDADGLVLFLGEGENINATGTESGYRWRLTHNTGTRPKVDGRPFVETVSLTSAPTARPDTHGVGEVIRVQIDFSQSMTAGSGAAVDLNFDGRQRRAPYVSGNGTKSLVFEYVVQATDRDADGLAVSLSEGEDITATGTEIGYSSGQVQPTGTLPKVDGSLAQPDVTAPTVSSVVLTSSAGADSTYLVGDTVTATVTFDENVSVSGAPQLELDIGGTARPAGYLYSVGATVVFSYTVQAGDADDDGVSIGADKISLNGGVIADGSGNHAVLSHGAVLADASHLVDAVVPTVSEIYVVSAPINPDTAYRDGHWIIFLVGFSETVTVTGTPQLELDLGGEARTASYRAPEDNPAAGSRWAYFYYQVATGDVDADGVSIGADKISLNGGTIRNSAGNDADLSHAANANISTHPVHAPGGV